MLYRRLPPDVAYAMPIFSHIFMLFTPLFRFCHADYARYDIVIRRHFRRFR